ncbi:Gfo/Idh/MocA family oxidoreductase [Paenarthrobacter sp. NPDC091669]|uniref:Gfo/Idh/MocA family oxidoreductase n=1 Tax=Paenarthrobacter sp. NPDC091669 TaxID=3364384 RepID=UPI0037F3B805
MRIGIVGYGAGGQYFHAPFIEAAEGIELVGVVARSEATKSSFESDFPGPPTYASLSGLIASGVDAVTITTPPHTRYDLVMEAIRSGEPRARDPRLD